MSDGAIGIVRNDVIRDICVGSGISVGKVEGFFIEDDKGVLVIDAGGVLVGEDGGVSVGEEGGVLVREEDGDLGFSSNISMRNIGGESSITYGSS